MSNHDYNSNASARRSSAPVQRWCDALLHLTGCSPPEIAEKMDMLLRFCANHAVSPERMIEECRLGPDRMARRAFYLGAARKTQANLVIQSFLVHNGINVFGELVCMPGTTESLEREQGEHWRARRS